jgi:2-hydroxy-6-oxonona-2,4-dienedioate hydrolase
MVSIPDVTFENTTKIVDTKDYRIQVNEAGEGHPVFLIHGGGPGATGWSNYSQNVGPLSRKFRVIVVTMPGWGESSFQTVQTGRDGVEALKQLSDAMGIEKAAYIGNSMGGSTALQLASKYPTRVSHLVTMGVGNPAATSLFQPAGPAEGIRILVEAYQDPSPKNMKRLVQIMCFDPKFASDELAQQRSDTAHKFPEHNANWLELLRSGPPMSLPAELLTNLSKSSVPTLLIHGRDDRTCHFEASLRLVGIIPNSRLVLLNRCGHWAQLEHPDEFNRLVEDFVANNREQP